MYSEKFNQLHQYYLSRKTFNISQRIQNLKKLKKIIIELENEIFKAGKKDFGRNPIEMFESELATLYKEIDYACKYLHSWTKPQKVPTEFFSLLGNSYIYQQPYGVVLIISPWNFPFLLTLLPLVHAIAAGNCVLIKPSEFAPEQALIIEKIINNSFDSANVVVVQGDAKIAQDLIQLEWDYIFFTGSSRVGKIVYQEAAKKMIPVTLELGGKNPVIVTDDADIEYSSKKLVWGKFFNAGQSCIAPDYVLVDIKKQEQLLDSLKKQIKILYGKDPRLNKSYSHIVNEAHLNRLKKLLDYGTIIVGGESDITVKYFSPTILTNINLESSLMSEEIFGPILPVIAYNNLDQAIKIINQKPKSLAFYIFSSNSKIQEELIQKVSAGGGCINDVLIHHNSTFLPFGGIGESGIGAYHGKFGFETFSHKKSIFKSNKKFGHFLYPPYKKSLLSFLRWWYQ